MNKQSGVSIDVDVLSVTLLGNPYNVILFNDDHHDMVEVSVQIMKAINCDANKAMALMNEAHTTGRAVVFTGGLERCELVSSILEEIRLGTRIEPA